jgi:hypothetical protein
MVALSLTVRLRIHETQPMSFVTCWYASLLILLALQPLTAS